MRDTRLYFRRMGFLDERPRRGLDDGIFSPLSLAAYATWALVMTDFWLETRDGNAHPWAGLAAGAAFLLGFVLREVSSKLPAPRLVELGTLAVQVVASLVAIAYSGSGAAAVLLVIFAAQLAACVPMPVTVATLVVANVGVYFIYAANWAG